MRKVPVAALRPHAGSTRVARNAGITAQSADVIAARDRENSTMRKLMPASSAMTCSRVVISASSEPAPHFAISSPAAAAIEVSTIDSVSICRTSLPRPAPIARRTAISRRRAAPRASSRLAALAAATTSSSATRPKRNHKGLANRLRTREKPARADSSDVWRPRKDSRLSAGTLVPTEPSSTAGQKLCNAVFASASDTPSRRRPIRCTQLEVADCSDDGLALLVSGIVISGATPGATPKNPFGVTPTMV